MGGVKKIKYSRTKGGRYSSKHPCACMTVYGMDRCVATWDAKTDMMYYKGIPCEHCKAPINKWENEYTLCKDCIDAEVALFDSNPWYAETIYSWGTPMHQEVTEYVDLDKWFEELLSPSLGS